MPKRISKRPSDINQAAHLMVERSTAGPEQLKARPKVSRAISRIMSKMGRKGGKIGGKRSLVTLSPEERRERASRAARVRWAKKKTSESA
jgi:hypothetical protein